MPSEFIAPEYQGWFVEMQNGEIIQGREIDQERRSIQLITLDGHEHDFPRADVASWGALTVKSQSAPVVRFVSLMDGVSLPSEPCSARDGRTGHSFQGCGRGA